ncbi:MAG: sigma-E factor negative regulatory protein [Gammaproteobacteria bacterium]|nr:sigma-E factor negative regulatory protein [Gammaproteobacteria bacterium]
MKLVSNNQQSNPDAESISALVDGELTSAEVTEQIPSLLSGGREREQWQNYHLMRDVLQQQLPHQHNPDFSQRVMQQLENEPTILAPKRKNRTLSQQMIGVGLAASVAAVALLSSYVINDPNGEQSAQMVADAQSGQKVQVRSQDLVEVDQWKRAPELAQVKQDPDLEQFSSYLANHAASSAGSRNQGFMPYARVVGYSNEK